MKNLGQISLWLFTFGLTGPLALAEQPRNQYSRSLMFQAPETYEDPNFLDETERHNQFCRDQQKKIDELKNRPLRRNAEQELYQKECLEN